MFHKICRVFYGFHYCLFKTFFSQMKAPKDVFRPLSNMDLKINLNNYTVILLQKYEDFSKGSRYISKRSCRSLIRSGRVAPGK